MPKLTVLVACEKTIFDRTGPVSVISIFQRMRVQIGDSPLPNKAVAPNRWSIFALWQHTPEELGVAFKQHTEVILPDGTTFAEASVVFKISDADDLQSKNNIDLLGIPIEIPGFIHIRVWLEGIPDSTGEYSFHLEHVPSATPSMSPTDA